MNLQISMIFFNDKINLHFIGKTEHAVISFSMIKSQDIYWMVESWIMNECYSGYSVGVRLKGFCWNTETQRASWDCVLLSDFDWVHRGTWHGYKICCIPLCQANFRNFHLIMNEIEGVSVREMCDLHFATVHKISEGWQVFIVKSIFFIHFNKAHKYFMDVRIWGNKKSK